MPLSYLPRAQRGTADRRRKVFIQRHFELITFDLHPLERTVVRRVNIETAVIVRLDNVIGSICQHVNHEMVTAVQHPIVS